MKLKMVVVDLELSTRAKRVAAVVAIPLLLLGGGAVAYANVPHEFHDGEMLKADELNKNFVDIDSRLAKVETSGRFVGRVGEKAYSVGLTQYCGATASSYLGADVGGYDGAKSKCETACSSPSAHMCGADEVWRLAQLGAGPKESGWMAGATGAPTNGPVNFDCKGWLQNGSVGSEDWRGTTWSTSQKLIGQSYCWQGPQKVLCCD